MARTIALPENPVLESVTGLTNKTFDTETYMGDRMTTEDQVLQCWDDIKGLRERADACCRDLLIWEARVQVVRMYSNKIGSGTFAPSSGGIVVSSFDENVVAGTMRRGKPYTVRFPLKWDSTLYTIRNPDAAGLTNCDFSSTKGILDRGKIVNYRIVEDDFLGVATCDVNSGGYAGFWVYTNTAAESRKTVLGQWINRNNNWGQFEHATLDDGTVLITDHRGQTDFTVIRYYTQWALRECADGSIIAD